MSLLAKAVELHRQAMTQAFFEDGGWTHPVPPTAPDHRLWQAAEQLGESPQDQATLRDLIAQHREQIAGEWPRDKAEAERRYAYGYSPTPGPFFGCDLRLYAAAGLSEDARV